MSDKNKIDTSKVKNDNLKLLAKSTDTKEISSDATTHFARARGQGTK